jgi:hypothetical protein
MGSDVEQIHVVADAIRLLQVMAIQLPMAGRSRFDKPGDKIRMEAVEVAELVVSCTVARSAAGS